MRRKRVNHKDVAERAGVSVATVSYVVNNGPRPVSTKAREQVEKAIWELGYYPNELARSLRRQQSSTIGVIIPRMTNPVYAEVVRGLEGICTQEGFLVLLCNTERQPELERRFVQMLRAKHVDGVVITPHAEPQKLIEPLLQARIPVIVLEHDLPGVHCIGINELHGGLLATEHLLGLGHRRIALLKHKPTSALSTRRSLGYQQALEKAGLGLEAQLILECDGTHEAGYIAMGQLLRLSQPPTAVVAHDDVIAIGAMHAIYSQGLSIPTDISVVGYDDIASAAYLEPPLTTVRSPKAHMGTLAGQTLLKIIRSTELIPTATITLPVELIVRASTGRVKNS
ncbi:MAG: LacI family DNA-binding transcriptional regulator [Thermaceae bacterium]|nr:LacI family DNA-binding transcriptional regulator [Thermaceae bacterium]